jgi:hypothetical protein
MALRSVIGRILRREVVVVAEAGDVPDTSVLDTYVRSVPSAQNAVDLFAGTWSSRLPLDGVESGGIPLFEDDRVVWALERLGDLTGQTVLELGPLEAGHTYQLVNAGASVVAVESQRAAYLKCLVVKELLGLQRARFLMGDFMEHLRGTDEHYDVCFASGVLYHMRNPVETIALTAKAADRLVLWTHYYDEAVVTGSELLAPRFSAHEPATFEGFDHTLHRFNYESGLQLKGFCGGSAPHAMWLSRNDLFAALEHFGWTVDDIGFDDREHPHGPALALVATRAATAG